MKIKICGITNYEDALLCCDEGADYLGFIFYKDSKRYISPENAGEIISKLPLGIKVVGVFVNENIAEVNENAQTLGLSFVQLHGDESPEYIQAMQAPVLKAFRVSDKFDFGIVDSYPGVVPLFDTFSNSVYGGTGKAFLWNDIPVALREKCFLSGGISADNVIEAIQTIRPYGIDVSSSLEKYPGKKDAAKVREYFRIVKLSESRMTRI